MIRSLQCALALALAAPLLSACARPADAPVAEARQPRATARAPAVAAVSVTPAEAASVPAADPALPSVLVHKSATCGCCTGWVEHLRKAGFAVTVDEREDLEPLKKRLGVPLGKGSCHTAEVDGLVIEGHVPADDIKRLLANRGDARGLVLPGMPMGSPGMEVPGGRVQPYTVERIDADGGTSAFAQHGP
ncbi:DUF411 domain-containing protein [Lysobacter xanthus]